VNIMTSETKSFDVRETNLDAETLDNQKKQRERQTALIFAVLIGVLSSTGIVLIATGERPREPLQMSDCAALEPGTARLACFDELSRHATSEPFKGAPPAEVSGRK